MAFRIGTATLDFQPVQPEQSGDTVTGAPLWWEAVQAWGAPPLPLPTRASALAEVPWPEVQSRAGQTYGFFSWKCSGRGYEAECKLQALAEARGWRAKNVKDAQMYNYLHHVDFMFKLPDAGRECWVDVKSMRALRRGAPQQGEFMFVEMNTNGWLLGGQADVIAQEVAPGRFLLFDRAALAEYARRTVQTGIAVVPWPEQSLHRVYIRRNMTAKGGPTSVLSLLSTRQAFEAAGCGVAG